MTIVSKMTQYFVLRDIHFEHDDPEQELRQQSPQSLRNYDFLHCTLLIESHVN